MGRWPGKYYIILYDWRRPLNVHMGSCSSWVNDRWAKRALGLIRPIVFTERSAHSLLHCYVLRLMFDRCAIDSQVCCRSTARSAWFSWRRCGHPGTNQIATFVWIGDWEGLGIVGSWTR